MKVFITGINGFIGSALKKVFIEAGMQVDGCDVYAERNECGGLILKDRADSDSVLNYLSIGKPDRVYHLAAISTRQMAEDDILECYNTNVIATIKLALAAQQIGAKFVFMSSYLVEEKETSVYADSKLAAERAIKKVKGLDYSIIRFNNVFGPGDHSKTRIIPRTIRLVLDGKEPQINNPFSEISLDYIDEALDFILDSSNKSGTFKKQPVYKSTTRAISDAIVSVVKNHESPCSPYFLKCIRETVEWHRKNIG